LDMGTATMSSAIANTFSTYECQDTIVAYWPKATSPMAIFEILAIFKGGHHSKEGHGKSVKGRTSRVAFPTPSAAFLSGLLDYTSAISWLSIRGEKAIASRFLTIMWLNKRSLAFPITSNSLNTLYLLNSLLLQLNHSHSRGTFLAMNMGKDSE
jgi:hypothetical protein